MNTRYTLRAVALASVCLAPLAANAQESDFDVGSTAAVAPAAPAIYDNEAELGIRTQSQTSGVFGRYNGQVSAGAFVFGNFKLQSRDDWKSGNTQYFSLVGKNLDFGDGNNAIGPESSLAFKIGNQGKWGVKVGYDAISWAQSTQFSSPFDRKDALPSAVAANANINANLTPMFMGLRRDIGTVSGQFIENDLTFTGAIRHEHKEGEIEQSIRTAGVFPESVNYDTDRYDAGVAYNTKKLQAQLGYSLSNFTDNQLADNVFVPGITTGPYAYSLPPSNQAHSLTANVGYNVSPATRLNANFVYGLQLQNSPFPQNTSRGLTPVQSGELAMGPNGLGAVVNTYYGNVSATTRPMAGLDARISYTIDKRQDERSVLPSRALYGDWGANTVTGDAHSSMPVSWTIQTAKAEAGYKVLDSTKVSAGVTYVDTMREYSFVDHQAELSEWAKVKTQFSSKIDGMLGYTHGVRTSNAEVANSSGLIGFSGPGSNGAVDYNMAGSNMPYYEAGRVQDAVKSRAGYAPSDDIQLGLNGKFTYDKYTIQGNDTGMLNDYTLTFGPDITFAPNKAVTAHLFYNYEQVYHLSQNLSNGSTHQDYTTDSTADTTHVAGVDVDWKVDEKLKLHAGYTFMEGDTTFTDLNSQPGAFNNNNVASPIPGINMQSQSLVLGGSYELMPNITWYGSYGLDYMKSNDWAFSNPTGYDASINNGASLTDTAPSYLVSSFRTSVKVKW